MLRSIPVQNIYYLLLYAWDRFPEGKTINVSGTASPDLPNLLAKVLLEGARHLLRRGLDRGYVEDEQDLVRPRGRLRLEDTIRRALLSRTQVACAIDELSHDILQNQILKSTLTRLSKTKNVDAGLREGLTATLGHLTEVRGIEIAARDFANVKLGGNSALYGLLLRACQLVHEALVPEPGEDRFRFRDVLTDPQAMGRIFQSFIRNFYRLEQSDFKVKADAFDWPVRHDVGRDHYLMPRMNTDVALHSPTRTIIIECKWTPDTFQRIHGTKSLRSEHLYQLNAYVQNHPRISKDHVQIEGIVLYPESSELVDVDVCLNGHWIGARTVDLQCDWPAIREQLLAVIASAPRDHRSDASVERR
jgi:5-methylcytosine-specific restriction enzyme subunit McrC